MNPARFRHIVWAYHRKSGRHTLPWRKTRDIYKILVSEVMLQQTQVERVIPLYKKFIQKFPTPKKLAAVPLSDVLTMWQGLGYNRRAKMLHQAAQEVAKRKIKIVTELEALPGVGPYTARAIAAFAWNLDVVFVETNIRTVVIHHFFPNKKKVSDKEIEKILAQMLPRGLPAQTGKSREWYSALMDYGAYLKKTGVQVNAKSMSYAKQPKFAGSLREARGAILREYTKGVTSRAHLINLFGPTRKAQMTTALSALTKEGLINESLVSVKSSRRPAKR